MEGRQEGGDAAVPAESVLAQLQPFTWSDDETIAYEVAVFGISQVMAWYSARIWEERGRPEPDRAAIDRWVRARRRCVKDQQQLRLADAAQTAMVIEAYAAELGRLTGTTDG